MASWCTTEITVLLLLAVSTRADEPTCEASITPRARVPGLRYVEFGDDGTADAGKGRVARIAHNILELDEVATLASAVENFEASEKHLDSTDGLPAYEMYVRHKGKDTHTAAAVLPAIEARIGAFVGDKYGCSECYVCSLLLRRYKADERQQVKTHFDRMAYVTAVASLNPAEFDGGLFLQRTARADSREFFATSGRDAAFHQYDLNHGVDVQNGTRLSAVFWITDTEMSCRKDLSPWYLAPAEAGSADAQDALGELYQLGQHGYARDARKAVEWATKAAEQGNEAAQSRLGRLLLAGEGVPRDPQLGLSWVRKAAEQGYSPAEYTMGVACQYGDLDGGLEEAARWFRLAAEAGVAAAQYEMGVALVNGDGVAMDQRKGVDWLQKAAIQGKAEAIADLETLARAGIIILPGIEPDEPQPDESPEE